MSPNSNTSRGRALSHSSSHCRRVCMRMRIQSCPAALTARANCANVNGLTRTLSVMDHTGSGCVRCAMCGLAGLRLHLACVCPFFRLVGLKIDEFSTADVANLVWSFAKLGAKFPRRFRRAVERFVSEK